MKSESIQFYSVYLNFNVVLTGANLQSEVFGTQEGSSFIYLFVFI